MFSHTSGKWHAFIICKFKFAEPFIDVDLHLQHAFRSQFHALELILRVLISILGTQIFDMIDAVFGNLAKARQPSAALKSRDRQSPTTTKCDMIPRTRA